MQELAFLNETQITSNANTNQLLMKLVTAPRVVFSKQRLVFDEKKSTTIRRKVFFAKKKNGKCPYLYLF